MLNLVMTQSSRMAAMATGRPYGEDVVRNPGVLHRIAWLRKERHARPATGTHTATEQALRERTA